MRDADVLFLPWTQKFLNWSPVMSNAWKISKFPRRVEVVKCYLLLADHTKSFKMNYTLRKGPSFKRRKDYRQ